MNNIENSNEHNFSENNKQFNEQLLKMKARLQKISSKQPQRTTTKSSSLKNSNTFGSNLFSIISDAQLSNTRKHNYEDSSLSWKQQDNSEFIEDSFRTVNDSHNRTSSQPSIYNQIDQLIQKARGASNKGGNHTHKNSSTEISKYIQGVKSVSNNSNSQSSNQTDYLKHKLNQILQIKTQITQKSTLSPSRGIQTNRKSYEKKKHNDISNPSQAPTRDNYIYKPHPNKRSSEIYNNSNHKNMPLLPYYQISTPSGSNKLKKTHKYAWEQDPPQQQLQDQYSQKQDSFDNHQSSRHKKDVQSLLSSVQASRNNLRIPLPRNVLNNSSPFSSGRSGTTAYLNTIQQELVTHTIDSTGSDQKHANASDRQKHLVQMILSDKKQLNQNIIQFKDEDQIQFDLSDEDQKQQKPIADLQNKIKNNSNKQTQESNIKKQNLQQQKQSNILRQNLKQQKQVLLQQLKVIQDQIQLLETQLGPNQH